MEKRKKIRVLHLIDGLGGGGSEEWVKDIVRLANKERFEFVTASIVRYLKGSFSYKDDIENLGVKVVFLEDTWFNKNGSLLEKEVPLIKGVMNRYSPSPLINLFMSLGAYSIRDRKFHSLSLVALNALIIFLKLFGIACRERIDVIHAHLFYSFIFGALAAKLLKIPIVYIVPSLKSQLDGPKPWMFPMYRRFGSLVDFFVTGISAEELTSHCNIPAHKIALIHTSVDLSKVVQINRENNPVISQFNLQNSYPIILSVARFDPSKGHNYSIEAVKLLKNEFPTCKLVILGEGYEFDEYKAKIKSDALLQQIVIMPGFVSDTSPFYSAADIYLRTTIFEGMNRASALAMAYAKPIVAFDTKAPTEGILHGKNGLLVPTGDANALVDAIKMLAKDQNLRRELGENARKFCKQNYDMLDTIRTFENIYSRLASQK